MAINHWPETERPREKLRQRGPQALSDAELLQSCCAPVYLAKPRWLGRVPLTEIDVLHGLFAASQTHLCAAPRLGSAKYAGVQAVLELARRHLGESRLPGAPLTDPAATRRYLVAQLRDRDPQVSCCLYLDNRHRGIAFEELFHGTLDGASVHPREVVHRVLAHNAAAVIFAHPPHRVWPNPRMPTGG